MEEEISALISSSPKDAQLSNEGGQLSSPSTPAAIATTITTTTPSSGGGGGSGNGGNGDDGGEAEALSRPGVQTIVLGKTRIAADYLAPYPEEYAQLPLLHICEWCLKYMSGSFTAQRHLLKCPWRHPPGDEVYRADSFSIFEVDGRKHRIYCQNLCLLAKLFLDHKTLYYDVEPFLFYILTEVDDEGCHIVGYFSKEKRSANDYNLSCIVVLPPGRRKGYGATMMDLSYLLSRKECRVGTPERPLSDLGAASYRSYWANAILSYLLPLLQEDPHHSPGPRTPSITEIGLRTGMTRTDILETLKGLGISPLDTTSDYPLIPDVNALARDYATSLARFDAVRVHPEKLHWSPFLIKDFISGDTPTNSSTL
ncbi:MAG: acyl-CoA N-acyltransferase [Piptocephalis tieghemiana]|nr:MAG: acyl-CoA N-acyltransferase [Piptocephalis tieghemiana]